MQLHKRRVLPQHDVYFDGQLLQIQRKDVGVNLQFQ
jgi:hypothetical protein